MNIIIIEDELLARQKLCAMLLGLDPSINILAMLGSVKESITWLQTNTTPDLAFVDIQLSDDHSFEIFRQHQVSFPVVFTTAYDKFLLESFEFNSIDYILKPITEEKLRRSIGKVNNLRQHFQQQDLAALLSPQGARRIVCRQGTASVALATHDIAYCYTEHKIVFARDFNGRHFIIDKNLGALESILGKNAFFRINRKFIAQAKAIERFKSDNGKIRIFLTPEVKEPVHVSKETAKSFRAWIKGESH